MHNKKDKNYLYLYITDLLVLLCSIIIRNSKMKVLMQLYKSNGISRKCIIRRMLATINNKNSISTAFMQILFLHKILEILKGKCFVLYSAKNDGT